MAAAKKPMHAQGTKLSYTIGETKHTIANISSIGEIAQTSEEVDVTTLDSEGGYREYMQGMRDSGEVELTGYHDAGDAGQKALRSAYADGKIGTFQVDFPDGSRVEFSGFVKGHTIGAAEVDGAVGFGAVVRISGAVTVTEAV